MKEQVGIDNEQVGIGEGCEQVGMIRLREELVGWFAYATSEMVCQTDRDLREVMVC